jgi:WD40 repeat protein
MTGLTVQAFGLIIGMGLAAAGLPISPATLSTRAVVSSGHRGAVLDMAEDGDRGLLFSVGEDGFLRVWDAEAGTLVRKIAMTRQRIASIALDPVAPRAAVVVTDGVRSFAVQVWNWDTEKLLYSIPLGGAPLFVRFSRSGSYLLCGDMQWTGLHIHRSRDGSAVPFHPEGFGMVGFAEVSRSDATLLTYQPSGTLTYWDMATGAVIREMPAAAGLVNVRTSEDRTTLVGLDGSEVVGVDALTGGTRFRRDASGIASMDTSPDAVQIAFLQRDGTLRITDSTGRVPDTPPIAGRFDWTPRLVRMSRGTILLAGDDGQIGSISRDNRSREFASDLLARVSGVAARDDLLVVAADDLIHVLRVGGRSAAPDAVSEVFSVRAPFAGPVSVLFMDPKKLLVWKSGDGPGALGEIDLATRQFRDCPVSFDGPLTAVSARGGVVYTLEKSGEVRVFQQATGAQLFRSRWPGAVCIAPLGTGSLVLGRLAGGAVASSLVRIELGTGETAPLPGSETLTFALAPDPKDGTLYTLGMSADGHTTLSRYDGSELQSQTIVDSARGEYVSASLTLDPSSSYLYTSLGREVVRAWTGRTMERLAEPARATLTLCALGGVLASLERDSSISLWDTAADRSFGGIYPFRDGSWAAIMADGAILGSSEGRQKVGIIINGRLWDDGDASPAPPSHGQAPAPY